MIDDNTGPHQNEGCSFDIRKLPSLASF